MVRLGRYTVLQHLASGGMADVLLGKTEGIEGFERHVVLKRIRPEHARDQHFIKMFLDEARVAASLHHQNIIQVHDIGEADGEYFFAMEYIHGEDLRAILKAQAKLRTHVPLPFVIAIIAAAAAGLHHAHERRGSDKRPLHIVHRDVSPSNILVGYDGSIKLFDFGIAKAGNTDDTLAGHLKGKIAYMSPEQVTNGVVDRRSDVYALGVVLYELATTTRLFRGDSDHAVMEQIVHSRVPLPRVRRPDLSNELSTIIMTALSPDPERRYQSADELRAALDQYAELTNTAVQPAQLAAYMRKLFGDKPEPWLDVSSRASEAVEELMPTSISVSRAPQTWSGLDAARGSKPSNKHVVTARGTGTLPRNTRPFALVEPAITTDRHVKVVHAQLDVVDPPPPPPSLDIAPVGRTKLMLLGAAIAAAIVAIAIVVTSGSGDVTPAVATAATPPPALPHPIVEPISTGSAAAQTPALPAPVVETVKKPAPHIVPRHDKHVDKPAVVASLDKPAPAKVDVKADKPPIATFDKPAAVETPVVAVTASTSAITPVVAPPAPVMPAPPPAPAAPPEIPTLANAMVERVAASHGRELSQCEGGSTLHGDIAVRFMVDTAGHVQKPQIATKGITNMPKLTACILRSIMHWQFPKQGAEGAQGSYTLSFQ